MGLHVIGLAVAAVVAAAAPWPGDGPAHGADAPGVLGPNLSGLAPAGPEGLWAVRDAPGALLVLDRVDGAWSARAGWGDGRPLRYPDGQGSPDAEAVTTVAGDAAVVYVGAERDNAAPGAARNSVLRVPVDGTGPLRATSEWRLDGLIDATGPNTGIEGLAWVPDDVVVAAGLRDRSGRPYLPAEYPAHRGGLFVVGVERRAELAVVLLADDGTAALVTTVATGLASVTGLHWDAVHAELWAVCDDTCGGLAALVTLRDGAFTVAGLVQPPAGSASLDNEGFARLACRGDHTVVVWADDAVTDGHALREATLACSGAVGLVAGDAPVTTPPAPTAPGSSAAVAPPEDAGGRSGGGGAGLAVGLGAAALAGVLVACVAARSHRSRRSRPA